jgi:hypothetical protein
MREKKEYPRNNLPHFQQPGQAYFLTWNLKDVINNWDRRFLIAFKIF